MHAKAVSTLLRLLGRLLAAHGDTVLHDLPLIIKAGKTLHCILDC